MGKIVRERRGDKLITLYTTHCPKCTVLETKLKSKGVVFDINENEEEMISKGFQSLPVLTVDGNNLDFMAAIKWVNELGVN